MLNEGSEVGSVHSHSIGVNGSVRRITTAFNSAGLPELLTSYDAATAGNVVNEVRREYNGLHQLTKEYQNSTWIVDTGTTPKVQYAWSEMASDANNSRLTSVTYPIFPALPSDRRTCR